jgi:hypothetical protein
MIDPPKTLKYGIFDSNGREHPLMSESGIFAEFKGTSENPDEVIMS